MPALIPDRVPPCFSSPSLSNVNEVELDLLFTMAFSSSPSFARQMFARVYKRPSPVEVIGAWRSAWRKLPSGREAQWDVCVLVDCGLAAPSLLLVEDKLTSRFQPDQAAKYHEFGKHGLAEGWWGEYKRCLCASAEYLQACVTDHKDWDACISFEEIRDWFLQEEFDPMAIFMAAMLHQAAVGIRKERKRTASLAK